jgi:hypothetical protein
MSGTVSGCLWAPDLSAVRRDIERQLPGARFNRKIELTLGRISLAFTRLITRFVPAARDAGEYLHDVKRIEIAIYEIELVPTPMSVSMPEPLRRLQEEGGWELAVRVNQDDESVWLLYRAENDTVTELYLVVLSDKELILVKTEGRLERIVAAVLSESPELAELPTLKDAF